MLRLSEIDVKLPHLREAIKNVNMAYVMARGKQVDLRTLQGIVKNATEAVLHAPSAEKDTAIRDCCFVISRIKNSDYDVYTLLGGLPWMPRFLVSHEAMAWLMPYAILQQWKTKV